MYSAEMKKEGLPQMPPSRLRRSKRRKALLRLAALAKQA
jgi:hypothetical protein